MLKILKDMQFYIYVVVFAFIIAMFTPSMMMDRMNEDKLEQEEMNAPPETILEVLYDGDGSYSVRLHDEYYTNWDENQVDSLLVTLLAEI
jgi:hypothetical protein